VRYAAIAGAVLVALAVGSMAGFFVALYLQDAETKYGSGITQSSEAVIGQSDREAGRKQGIPPPTPKMPASIVEAERASQTECGSAENCRSEQRDYQDLRAQWKAADAAYGQYTLAKWSLALTGVGALIAGIGTWYLISTFKENRRTADAAVASVQVMQEMERANLVIDIGDIADIYRKQSIFVLKIKNIGRSSAVINFGDGVLCAQIPDPMPLQFSNPPFNKGVIPQDDSVIVREWNMKGHEFLPFFCGVIDYTDIFRNSHLLLICMRIDSKTGELEHLSANWSLWEEKASRSSPKS